MMLIPPLALIVGGVFIGATLILVAMLPVLAYQWIEIARLRRMARLRRRVAKLRCQVAGDLGDKWEKSRYD